jgi:hypothetical protein
MTVIETAKLNGLDPLAYLTDIFDRIHDHKFNSWMNCCRGIGCRHPHRKIRPHKLRYQRSAYDLPIIKRKYDLRIIQLEGSRPTWGGFQQVAGSYH